MQIHRLPGAQAQRELETRRPPSLLLFSRPGCGGCRAMKAALDDWAPADPRLAGLWICEVDPSDHQGLTEEHRVFHLPALFFYSQADFHGEVQAVPSAQAIEAAVLAVMAGPRGSLD